MRIEINTENLTIEEKNILFILSGHVCPVIEKPQPNDTIEGLGGVKLQIDTPRHRKEAIILLLDKLGSMEPMEISKRLDISENTVRSQLYKLIREKIVDRSSSRPIKYFLNKKGDDELMEALKNVKKRN